MASGWRHVACAQCGAIAPDDEVLCERCSATWKPSERLLREHAQALANSQSIGDVLGPKCRICVALVAAGYGEFGEKPTRLPGNGRHLAAAVVVCPSCRKERWAGTGRCGNCGALGAGQ